MNKNNLTGNYVSIDGLSLTEIHKSMNLFRFTDTAPQTAQRISNPDIHTF